MRGVLVMVLEYKNSNSMSGLSEKNSRHVCIYYSHNFGTSLSDYHPPQLNVEGYGPC
jgi:hypothetical protein